MRQCPQGCLPCPAFSLHACSRCHSVSSGLPGNGLTSGLNIWDGMDALSSFIISILLFMLGQWLDRILQPLQSHAALSLGSALVP